jgi:thioredoxin-related protein
MIASRLRSGLVPSGNEDLAQRYGLTNMPLTLLIDRQGKIACTHAGLVEKNAFEGELRTLVEDHAAR